MHTQEGTNIMHNIAKPSKEEKEKNAIDSWKERERGEKKNRTMSLTETPGSKSCIDDLTLQNTML